MLKVKSKQVSNIDVQTWEYRMKVPGSSFNLLKRCKHLGFLVLTPQYYYKDSWCPCPFWYFITKTSVKKLILTITVTLLVNQVNIFRKNSFIHLKLEVWPKCQLFRGKLLRLFQDSIFIFVITFNCTYLIIIIRIRYMFLLITIVLLYLIFVWIVSVISRR